MIRRATSGKNYINMSCADPEKKSMGGGGGVSEGYLHVCLLEGSDAYIGNRTM